MVSISSKNDLTLARNELERHGLWELVIFARINWEPKGAQVRDLIEAAQLRAENVLFVDDNHLNREEAAFFASGLQVADPAEPGLPRADGGGRRGWPPGPRPEAADRVPDAGGQGRGGRGIRRQHRVPALLRHPGLAHRRSGWPTRHGSTS